MEREYLRRWVSRNRDPINKYHEFFGAKPLTDLRERERERELQNERRKKYFDAGSR